MGEAILAALIARKLARSDEIIVADVSEERRQFLANKYAVLVTESNAEAVASSDIVILAVKPQHLDDVFRTLEGQLRPEQMLLSIIAGKKIATLREGLKHKAIVRAMPNTPAQIGKGMTVWTATEEVNDAQEDIAREILGVMGHNIYAPDESVLDMATAVSGSGPAYVFIFIESLIRAGVAIGLTPGFARTLVFQTVLGSAEYALQSDKDLETLRHQVTSPGGTTAAALEVLDQGFFPDMIKQAVAAAYRRAKDLGNIK